MKVSLPSSLPIHTGKTLDRPLATRTARVAALVLPLLLWGGRNEVRAQTFGKVAIGGGGFVSSLIACPTQQNLIYAKTDVGGVARWSEPTQSWIPLFDWVSSDQTSYLGTESFAVDPQSPNKVYALAGTSYWNGGKTAILRSTDYGNTYAITDVTPQFKANGNGSDRQKGESLVVDPNKGSILFCGTRYNNGLFKSTDSGVTWTKTSLDVSDASISFVIFDKRFGTAGNATQRLYVGVFRTGLNIYTSSDGGNTWSALTGSPSASKPERCELAGNGMLFVTYGEGSNGCVKKYNTLTGVWTDCTPGMAGVQYSGISVSKSDPNKLVVSSYNMWWNQQQWGWADFIYYSTDGGITWAEKASKAHATMDPNGVPWITGHAMHWIGSVAIDPFNPERVFVVSGNGIFATQSISAPMPVWKFVAKGLEEIVPLNMISVPGGPFISSVGDQGGFVHTDINAAPTASISQSSGFACAPANPWFIARVATDLYYSQDKGATWIKAGPTSDNMTGGKVAVSANGSILLWKSTVGGVQKCYRTTNQGLTWTASNGLNFPCDPVGDPVNSSKFYAYNSADGYLYVSFDGGQNFTKNGFAGTGGKAAISTVPGFEGRVWIALNGGGLAYSWDAGTVFTEMNVFSCNAVSVGKIAPGAAYPAVYVWGKPTSTSVAGLYRSNNKSSSWVRINNDAHEYGGLGNAGMIEADLNVYGRVFMSTAGLGIPYIDSAAIAN